jgi:hypothetical protein
MPLLARRTPAPTKERITDTLRIKAPPWLERKAALRGKRPRRSNQPHRHRNEVNT